MLRRRQRLHYARARASAALQTGVSVLLCNMIAIAGPPVLAGFSPGDAGE
jgi:hypothetical protein